MSKYAIARRKELQISGSDGKTNTRLKYYVVEYWMIWCAHVNIDEW